MNVLHLKTSKHALKHTEKCLNFGITPWTWTWDPSLLSALGGAMVFSEISNPDGHNEGKYWCNKVGGSPRTAYTQGRLQGRGHPAPGPIGKNMVQTLSPQNHQQ